jgi:glycosyltransferase involved in cell wall biosynthesis
MQHMVSSTGGRGVATRFPDGSNGGPVGKDAASGRARVRRRAGNGDGELKWPRVSVVIPTFNEAANLPHVLPKIPPQVAEIVIVDGGSADETVEVARSLVPDVRIVHQEGHGKGDALVLGFAASTGDIVVTLDADGSARPEEIDQFVDVLLQGADLAKGSRFMTGGGSADITRIRRAGNSALGGLVNVLFGTRYSDLCYGYNAIWARCLPQLQIDCDGFEVETLINVRAAKARLCIVEVPSFEDRRLHGQSNLNAVRDGIRVLRTILRERFAMRRRPGDASEPALNEVG